MGVKIDYQNKIIVPNAPNGNGKRQLDTIYFTSAGYVDYPIKGISRDSALGWEEPVWGGDLTRSTDFVLTNILDVDYGLVARLEVSYKYLNVQDYIALCKIAKERVCNVTYFNYEKGEWVVNQEFAFTKQEKSKLYAFGTEYLGLLDVSVKLVATNRDKVGLINSTFTITYDANGGSGTVADTVGKYKTKSATWGDTVIIAPTDGITAPSGKTFKEWNTKADGVNGARYMPNQPKTMWENMTLYAIWE